MTSKRSLRLSAKTAILPLLARRAVTGILATGPFVVTAIGKVLQEPPAGFQFTPARFLKEDRMKKDMRIAALPVALLSIVFGIAGIASPPPCQH